MDGPSPVCRSPVFRKIIVTQYQKNRVLTDESTRVNAARIPEYTYLLYIFRTDTIDFRQFSIQSKNPTKEHFNATKTR